MAHALAEDLTDLVGDRADGWDRAGVLPVGLLRELGERGLLCAQVPAEFGGLGCTSLENGEFTAHVGGLCGSLCAVLTAHGSAAWTIERCGTAEQRASWLGLLTGGWLAAVVGGAMVVPDGDEVVVHGLQESVPGAEYADLLVVAAGSGAVVVPAMTPGVRVSRVEPIGCRAAGQADVAFAGVRVPAANVLDLGPVESWYGRLSAAWCGVGVLRVCFGSVGRDRFDGDEIADLFVATQVASRMCEYASRCWETNSPDLVGAVLAAQHVATAEASLAAGLVARTLATDGAARRYRDARLLEIVADCKRILAAHAPGTKSPIR